MAKSDAVYIVSAVRTSIGRFGGMLADFTHRDLGTIAVRSTLERVFGLPLPPELGHPIACAGSRILTTLIHEIRRPAGSNGSPKTGRRGLATLCMSGGLGVAVEIETV